MSIERAQDHLRASVQEVRSEAQDVAVRARRRTIDLARDTLYAGAGTIDLAAEQARHLTRRAIDLPSEILEALRQAPERVSEEFDALADRGRRFIHRVERNASLQPAASHVSAVRHATRTAGREARAAASATAGAVRDAAERVGTGRNTTPYEERTYDELYGLAVERNIEGRSTMTKDELIEALRTERSSGGSGGSTGSTSSNGNARGATAYEERTYDDLYALAAERNIEGRSTMTKDELISALRR